MNPHPEVSLSCFCSNHEITSLVLTVSLECVLFAYLKQSTQDFRRHLVDTLAPLHRSPTVLLMTQLGIHLLTVIMKTPAVERLRPDEVLNVGRRRNRPRTPMRSHC